MRRSLAAMMLCLGMVFVCDPVLAEPGDKYEMLSPTKVYRSNERVADRGQVVGDRPSGAPRRYCGYASAKKLNIPNPNGILNLALNWLKKFPRAAPAPGHACARPGHVFVILEVLGPDLVLAYDPNSGKGKTRIHERSIANCTVVNPHARLASM